MKLNATVFFLLASFLFLVSCEKEVKVNLTSGNSSLVVDGFIEKGYPPFVILTHSFSYFSKIDLSTVQNSFIHDAKVSVTDGARQINLREYTVDTLGYKLSFYSIDSADLSSLTFIGQTDHYYKLSVTSDGKTYESTTKIPNCKPIDSLHAVAPAKPSADVPDAMQLVAFYTDPDSFGNAVRYFTKRNSAPYYPGLNSVYDDEIVNGAKNAQLPLAAGQATTATTLTDSTGMFFKGDTVSIRWCAIDRNVYNFYNTLEYSLGTTGNPFSSPINVRTNISNGALGVWAGYGSTYISFIIPK